MKGGFDLNHFYLKLVALLAVFYIVLYSTEYVARKLLKTERKRFWSNQYVNDKHRKIEWILKGMLMVGLVVLGIVYLSKETTMESWFTFYLSYMLFTTIVIEIARAYMEKKYAQSKNQYIVTLIEMAVLSSFLLSIIATDLFGWLS